jgi:lipid-binding SYLF domain-containing protein
MRRAGTLIDMMRASDRGIPHELLDKAHCVVVVPGMKKAGFIFGAKYGRGFATCRKPGGSVWSAPAAMRVEGGSVGPSVVTRPNAANRERLAVRADHA